MKNAAKSENVNEAYLWLRTPKHICLRRDPWGGWGLSVLSGTTWEGFFYGETRLLIFFNGESPDHPPMSANNEDPVKCRRAIKPFYKNQSTLSDARCSYFLDHFSKFKP